MGQIQPPNRSFINLPQLKNNLPTPHTFCAYTKNHIPNSSELDNDLKALRCVVTPEHDIPADTSWSYASPATKHAPMLGVLGLSGSRGILTTVAIFVPPSEQEREQLQVIGPPSEQELQAMGPKIRTPRLRPYALIIHIPGMITVIQTALQVSIRSTDKLGRNTRRHIAAMPFSHSEGWRTSSRNTGIATTRGTIQARIRDTVRTNTVIVNCARLEDGWSIIIARWSGTTLSATGMRKRARKKRRAPVGLVDQDLATVGRIAVGELVVVGLGLGLGLGVGLECRFCFWSLF